MSKNLIFKGLLPAALFTLSATSGLAQMRAPETAAVAEVGAVATTAPSWDSMSVTELNVMADFVMNASSEHGLFVTASEQQSIQQLRMMSASSARSILVPLFTSMAKQLYGGRLTPQDVGNDIRFKKKTISEDTLRQLVVDAQGSKDKLVSGLAPKIQEYRMLVRALSRLKQQQALGPWEVLPVAEKSLKLGSEDASVSIMKKRLVALGFPISSTDNVIDSQTEAAITDVQRQLKQNPDRVISPGGATYRYLATSLDERVMQIRADLEKLRWLPQDPKDRYIFVNLAFSSLILIDKSQADPVVFNFRVINGREERKTPSMVDKIYQVILNPFWTVPPTVFIKDKVEIIKKLGYWEIGDYFYKNNYTIVSENFRVQYDPASIDWNNIRSSNAGFYIRQLPNYYNALGVVKFDMTNGEAIYLHDTGERNLFTEEMRLRSSGCVRVEKPMEMAEYLLKGTKWDMNAIMNKVSRPGEVQTNDTPIEPKSPIPVYMLPVTTHMAGDGVIRFTTDVYGHNSSIKSMTTYNMF